MLGSPWYKNPAFGGASLVWFFGEIDSDYSTPPAFPLRVFYSSQPCFHGFRLPDRTFKSEFKLDPEPRMTIVVSVSRNHAWVSKLFTVINSANMMPITVICSLVMIEFANVMAEFMMSMVMMVFVCIRSRWSDQHWCTENRSGSVGREEFHLLDVNRGGYRSDVFTIPEVNYTRITRSGALSLGSPTQLGDVWAELLGDLEGAHLQQAVHVEAVPHHCSMHVDIGQLRQKPMTPGPQDNAKPC